MKKEYLILAAIVAAGILAGCYVRGFTDAKGWTTNNG